MFELTPSTILHCLAAVPFLCVLTACSIQDGLHLTRVAVRDIRPALTMPEAGCNDVSRLHEPGRPGRVLELSGDMKIAEAELRGLLQEARRNHAAVSIAGARHSMGGHTLGKPGHYVVDMLGLKHMSRVFHDPGKPGRMLVTVGGGACWKDVIPALAGQGYAPKVMQSNSDFSVGGSLSVNCHGWQHNSEPIASTVRSIRIMTADGVVRLCDRRHNQELFACALGGYGLFGIILEATLEVVPDSRFKAEERRMPPADYVRTFEEMTRGSSDGMAYGRISVAPDSFLTEAAVTVLRPTAEPATRSLLPAPFMLGLKRLVFRATVGSDHGKNFRWSMEKRYGETTGLVQSRSRILSEPAALYGNRDPRATEVLHEYFIPKDRLAGFIEDMRHIHLGRDCPDLLNITVRNVKEDHTSFLRYARQEVFGLVMLFHQDISSKQHEEQMRSYTRAMIQAALKNGGTYYLVYRPHATQGQFEKAYPQAREFVRRKQKYDPRGLFQNQFYQAYLLPLAGRH